MIQYPSGNEKSKGVSDLRVYAVFYFEDGRQQEFLANTSEIQWGDMKYDVDLELIEALGKGLEPECSPSLIEGNIGLPD